MKLKLDVEIPKWMGEYRFEEEIRFAHVFLYHREDAFYWGFGYVAWVLSPDIWMVSPQ